jgi:hypothetical protein
MVVLTRLYLAKILRDSKTQTRRLSTTKAFSAATAIQVVECNAMLANIFPRVDTENIRKSSLRINAWVEYL